jgi:hypothetical protein
LPQGVFGGLPIIGVFHPRSNVWVARTGVVFVKLLGFHHGGFARLDL